MGEINHRLKVKGGAILLWRLGNLEFGKQDRWDRAPESRGMWAFPWPFYDSFFTYHQYLDRLPRNLRVNEARWPIDPSRYVDSNGKSLSLKTIEFDEQGSPKLDTDDYEIVDGFWDEQHQWIEKVGKRIHPIRKFWYEGDLYSHIDRNGEIGHVGLWGERVDWFRMDSRSLARAIPRSGGNHHYEMGTHGLQRWQASLDHLELFIPPNAGKISGRFKER